MLEPSNLSIKELFKNSHFNHRIHTIDLGLFVLARTWSVTIAHISSFAIAMGKLIDSFLLAVIFSRS